MLGAIGIPGNWEPGGAHLGSRENTVESTGIHGILVPFGRFWVFVCPFSVFRAPGVSWSYSESVWIILQMFDL